MRKVFTCLLCNSIYSCHCMRSRKQRHNACINDSEAFYSIDFELCIQFWVSSGEPAFWAHHTNIDRVWWMWQMLDPDVRAANVSTAVNGPITMYDLYQPHQIATIFDLLNLGYVAEGKEVSLGELMSTTEGMFCYVYK